MGTNDRELIARCISQVDDAAWEDFVRAYSRLIWSAIHKTVRSCSASCTPADAEDIYSTIFLSLVEKDFRKLRQFAGRNECSLSTWLTVVSVNHTIDHLRREKNRTHPKIEDLPEACAAVPDHRWDMESILMLKQEAEVLSRALAELPDEDRRIYELLAHQDHTPEQAAASLGISVPAFYTRKHRVIEKLKKIVSGL